MLTVKKQLEIITPFVKKHISSYHNNIEKASLSKIEISKSILDFIDEDRTDFNFINDMVSSNNKTLNFESFYKTKFEFSTSIYDYAKKSSSIIPLIDIQIKYNNTIVENLGSKSLYRTELIKLEQEKETLKKILKSKEHLLFALKNIEKKQDLMKEQIKHDNVILDLWNEFNSDVLEIKNEIEKHQ